MRPSEHGWLRFRATLLDGETIEHEGEYEYQGEHDAGLHAFRHIADDTTVYLHASEILEFGPRGEAVVTQRPPGLTVFGPDGEEAGELYYLRGFWIRPPATATFAGDLPAAAARELEEHGLVVTDATVERLRALIGSG